MKSFFTLRSPRAPSAFFSALGLSIIVVLQMACPTTPVQQDDCNSDADCVVGFACSAGVCVEQETFVPAPEPVPNTQPDAGDVASFDAGSTTSTTDAGQPNDSTDAGATANDAGPSRSDGGPPPVSSNDAGIVSNGCLQSCDDGDFGNGLESCVESV